MIFRKPYAFLIKNFRKIHIVLFILCSYILYKTFKTINFVNEFLDLKTYDMYNEPISRHISFILIIVLIVVMALSLSLAILFKRKNKPWKTYLIPVVEYAVMFVVLMLISSYFSTYTDTQNTTFLRILNDLLKISSFLQYGVFLLLLIRIFGVDLKSFNFQLDKEYLELSSEDREEFEVNIDVDKNSFIRLYKRLFRNIGYIYEEHKFLVNTIITVFTIIFVVTTIHNILLYRSYKQGSSFDINGYTIKINNSYYTNKDYKGDVIKENSGFLILDLSIKNNLYNRNVNFSKFHIMNGTHNYSYTSRTYETDFDDLGVTFDQYELKTNENKNLILIYKVDKELKYNRFVLYYQDYINNKPYLRKIKLDTKDISKINYKKEFKTGDDIVIQEGNKKKDLNFEQVSFVDNVNYTYQTCDMYEECETTTGEVSSKNNEKIMEISFLSDTFEGKDLIDFSSKYGKIDYIDSKDKKRTSKIKNAVNREYMGQKIYIRVPLEFETSKTKKIIYTVRNKKYIFKIK
ncbi:MAG: hypothetical protein IJF92_03960 [Bacilli bacterium]|nr:hypothetical protein [Bacilli bacterium]